MENLFLTKFKESGMTYPELGDLLNTAKSNAHIYINKPGRAKLLTMINVGSAIGMTAEEVKVEWKKHKLVNWEKIVDREIDSV